MQKINSERVQKLWKKYGKPRKELPHYKRRLPELSQLRGVYPIEPQIPSWWKEFVEALERRGRGRHFERPIVELFKNISFEEFKKGQFDGRRHKELREKLSEKQKKIISSPRIGKFLIEQFGANNEFTIFFNNRGDKSKAKEIVISDDPYDIITMAMRGKSWTSCMDLTGYGTNEIWSNLCDPAMLVIFVRTKGKNSRKDMDTRVILRCFRRFRTKKWGVVLDRFYGDESYVFPIQNLILRLCKERGFHLFEFVDYDSHQEYRQRERIRPMAKENSKIFDVFGPSVSFPDDERPYLDNSYWVEEKRQKEKVPCYQKATARKVI